MNRFTRRLLGLLFVGASLSCLVAPQEAEAAGYYRQSYTNWSYHPVRQYYYCRYTYYPTVSTTTIHYHYAVHYQSQPRYVYYYNPVRRTYWGRYDLESGDYSMLKKEDRREDLESISESAFPEPGEMPPIPQSTDGERMAKPELSNLPRVKAARDTP